MVTILTRETNMKISFAGLLFIVLLVLKLTEVIAWSWWWITAPLWAGLVIWAAITLIVLIFAVVATILEYIREV